MSLHYFNPTCELETAQQLQTPSVPYQATKILKQFTDDMSLVPLLLAQNADSLLHVGQVPRQDFTLHLEDLGFPKVRHENSRNIQGKHFLDFKPWGWSPAMLSLVEKLGLQFGEDFTQSLLSKWHPEQAMLKSRKTALKVAQHIAEHDLGVHLKDLPEVCETVEQVEAQLQTRGKLVLKAPYSSSGRGVQMLRKPEINKYIQQWIRATLAVQGVVMMERLYDRVLDFGFQFKVENGKVLYDGLSFFEVNANGSYQGNFVGSYPRCIPAEYLEIIKKQEQKTVEALRVGLEFAGFAKWHKGALGVDAFLYRKGDQILLNPCVEINCRNTMGTVANRLTKLLTSNSYGRFQIYFNKQGNYQAYIAEQQALHPLVCSNGKIKSGVLSLTEPSTENKFGMYCWVRG